MKSTLTFLLNDIPARPGGGIKVILEYANMLASAGYKVRIVYPGFLDWKKSKGIKKMKLIYHWIHSKLLGWKCSKWFKLNDDVEEVYSLSLNYRHVPPSDIYIATEARTAPYLNDYPIDEKRKFYFIQGYENWHLTEEELIETYRYHIKKIVISQWLHDELRNKGIDSVVVPNNFDFDYFRCNVPIEDREEPVISMMYSETPLKDSATTLKAIRRVKQEFPNLKVNVFGTSSRPEALEDWFHYIQKPNQEEHNRIYNGSSVFVASSRNEGWGLTVGEAMICGAAVVCTDIPGYREMVKEGETGLLSPVGDAESLANNIARLLKERELRIRIASCGRETIKEFSREKSLSKFIKALEIE